MGLIEDFIKRRFNEDCHWLDGNCYYFAIILITRFPHLVLVYLPIDGHFMAYDKEHNIGYDFTGGKQITEPFYYFNDLKETEPNLYKVLIRDCIL